ncbi:type II toxin-antitoxin system VapC family toxin [Pelagibacterium lacus]|uniref:type II toxin-antitoxin system VapC family toxin n=1 Tax=Pelagibacterium lacus TaxID=2282655 RepID=UPI001314DD97|nr:type II toxin-antitoxin system VapC family toxin [Pelagibacterium lacus]
MPFEKIYLDSNVFISVAAGEVSGIGAAVVQFATTAAPSPKFATSELALSEVLVHPFRFNDTVLASQYRSLIVGHSWIEALAVEREILIEAAALRARNGYLKLPDAIHISTALACGCSHMLTDDRRLRDAYASWSGDARLAIIRPTLETLDAILAWVRA